MARSVPICDEVHCQEVDVQHDVGQIHVVSWNTAGWKKTCELLRKLPGGFSGFLRRHSIDIFCIQESKVTAKAVASDVVALGAEVEGFESWWACNEGAGSQRSGLNGVATFARKGLTLRADKSALHDASFDSEARCLLTDHGTFVILNVYAPNSAGGARLPYKVAWLAALQGAMQRVRAQGKQVILVGDLNLRHRPIDCYWGSRLVSLVSLSKLSVSSGADPELKAAAVAAIEAWPHLRAALRSKTIQSLETRNSRNCQVFHRWGVFVEAGGEKVRLGPPMESEDCAQSAYAIDGKAIDADGTVVFGPDLEGAAFPMQSCDVMCVRELSECIHKIRGVEWRSGIAKRIADEIGEVNEIPAISSWVKEALVHLMVDSFAAFHPNAQERFTCWNQHQNMRFENAGSRIDYVWADQSLFDAHAKRGADLYAGRCKDNPDSANAAHSAATLGGLSQPAGLEGGGLPALEEDEYLAHFREFPATGIIYTPPQLSDHVAVSLLLHGVQGGGTAEGRFASDACTKACQPHSRRKISDFFGKRAAPDAAFDQSSKKAGRGF